MDKPLHSISELKAACEREKRSLRQAMNNGHMTDARKFARQVRLLEKAIAEHPAAP